VAHTHTPSCCVDRPIASGYSFVVEESILPSQNQHAYLLTVISFWGVHVCSLVHEAANREKRMKDMREEKSLAKLAIIYSTYKFLVGVLAKRMSIRVCLVS
jgi:hypothetical protein